MRPVIYENCNSLYIRYLEDRTFWSRLGAVPVHSYFDSSLDNTVIVTLFPGLTHCTDMYRLSFINLSKNDHSFM